MSTTAYTLFDQIKSQLSSGDLFVEIGSERGGGSSLYFQNLANETRNDFITVDIDPIYFGPKIKTATMSGELFVKNRLPELNKQISIAFLDGFDWTYQPVTVRNGSASSDVFNKIDEYSKRNTTLNNVNSGVSHMTVISGMLPFMAEKCAVMFADTWFNHTTDTFCGKGVGAIYLLLAEGFHLLSNSYKSNYVLLGRNIQHRTVLPVLNLDRLSQKYDGLIKRADALLYDEPL